MLRGDNVMTGYYKDPENTAKTLEPDGWLHSGDLGYMDDDGFVFVTGRIKELIIKGGENIAPREIDEALLKHPAVLEAAAVGIPDAMQGEPLSTCSGFYTCAAPALTTQPLHIHRCLYINNNTACHQPFCVGTIRVTILQPIIAANDQRLVVQEFPISVLLALALGK
jgi:acyl-CoA synthetase (AMP-forming)/AMP-acid ligase II